MLNRLKVTKILLSNILPLGDTPTVAALFPEFKVNVHPLVVTVDESKIEIHATLSAWLPVKVDPVRAKLDDSVA